MHLNVHDSDYAVQNHTNPDQKNYIKIKKKKIHITN